MSGFIVADDFSSAGRATEVAQSRHGLGAALLTVFWRRLASAIPLLLALAALVFVTVEALPGDAVSAALGRSVTPEQSDQVRAELGLDGSAVDRFGAWLGGLVQGDLGESLTHRQPVAELASQRVANTLLLAAVSFTVLVPLAFAVGVASGSRPGSRTDQALSGGSLMFLAAPEFVVGTALAYLVGVRLGWAPAVSLARGSVVHRPSVLVLPAVTMVLVNVGYASRIIRSVVADSLHSDRAQMARLNGVSEFEVVRRHVLRPALAPAIQVLALIFVFLFSASLVVETVFQYPGVGQLLAESAATRDVTVVQSLTVILAAAYLTVTALAEALIVAVTPRLRTAL